MSLDVTGRASQPATEGAPGVSRPAGRWRLYARRFRRHRSAMAGLVVLVLLVLVALLGSIATPYTYTDVDFTALTQPPSPDHLLGTNAAGNDTYAQAVHGLGRSLVIGLVELVIGMVKLVDGWLELVPGIVVFVTGAVSLVALSPDKLAAGTVEFVHRGAILRAMALRTGAIGPLSGMPVPFMPQPAWKHGETVWM